ncbi:MAG: alpha-E domain-containing protein, partial [Methylococcaceae bacterium]|nr:alpha-E domain-containing protein [Methylococcaceae bacterium]
MLSRTADNLFWMARHIERAENTARVLDVAHSTSLLPLDIEGSDAYLWYAPLNITGCADGYEVKHGLARADVVTHYMALDPDNPASIYSCLRLARENARAVRGAITSEMWEVINDTWLELNRLPRQMDYEKLQDFFDWVKNRSHLFRGVTLGTIRKDIALSFIKLGTFLERADNTARILDVKYHILLPSVEDVGGAADYYQWGSLLKSVSAFEAYRKVYRDVISPQRVSELLIIRDDMPRSLHACMNEVESALLEINGTSGQEARRL